MTKFLLKCFFITTVLFLGVLVGIQIASNNLVNMTNDSSYSTSKLVEPSIGVELKSVNIDNLESNSKLTSHDLKGKQEKLEQIETFNLFSQVGMKLSDALDKLFSGLFEKLTSTIGNALM
ncbi:DUF3679 domain-containing protein [Bacillaceae bacterium IKA-2]|nr:DUF3679 domain-containing protein [Bacillaceae bacterium IKA-2]